jgi:hypothetical protein
MNPVVCELIVVTMRGLLLCGSNGSYDVSLDTSYCVPTDDMRRAWRLPFEEVETKLRTSHGEHRCP